MYDHSSGSKYPLHSHSGNGTADAHPAAEAEDDDEISLQEIFEVLYKGRWIVLGCLVGMLVLVGVYTALKAPEYEASSLLFVNKQQSTPRVGELIGLERATNDIANEIEILKSRTIALGVADKLIEQQYVPDRDERLNILKPTDEDEPPTRYDVMERLRERVVQVQPVSREVDLITVVATSIYPEEAALIADLYASEYVEYNRATSRRRMAASREFLDDMTSTFRQELEFAEDTLTTFLAQEQVGAPQAEMQQLYEQLRDLRQRQYEAQLERTAARTRLRELRSVRDRIEQELPGQIASGDDITLDRLRARIAEKITEIEEKYARDPSLREDPSQDRDLMRLLREVEELQDQVDERARSVVRQAAEAAGYDMRDVQSGDGVQSRVARLSSLQGEIARLEATEAVQEARLGVIGENLTFYEQQLNEIPNKEIALNRLERSMETQEQIYLSLIEQLHSARVAEQSELGYVDIVDEAIIPDKPVRPRVPLNLALGTILGLMLGIGGAFVRNAVDNKPRQPEELRKRGYSVIGVVPDMTRVIKSDFDGRERITVEGHSYDTRLISLLNPLSPTAECYRRLRTNLQFSRPDGQLKTVLVTSSGPGEGKSVTSMNLAITMAQTGRKTVYVDADLRRSTGHTMLGVAREPGLVDLLFEPYPKGLDSFGTDVDDLYVIPAGSSVPNPAEVLGSKKMSEFLNRLEKEFEVVIIDSPPVLAVTDALLLAPQSDATLLVGAAGETPWQALRQSTEALHDVGTRVSGVVLNRFKPQKAYAGYGQGYGYGYGYGYDEYYGEKPAQESA